MPIPFIALRGDDDHEDRINHAKLDYNRPYYAVDVSVLEMEGGSDNVPKTKMEDTPQPPPEFIFFLANTMVLGMNTFYWRARILEEGDLAAKIAFNTFLLGGWLCWLPAFVLVVRRWRFGSSAKNDSCENEQAGVWNGPAPAISANSEVPGPLLLLIFCTAATNMVIGTFSINHSSVSGMAAVLENLIMLVGWLCLLAALVYFTRRQCLGTQEIENF